MTGATLSVKSKPENPQIFRFGKYKNIFPLKMPRAKRRAF